MTLNLRVVMPVHNAGEYVAAAVLSVLHDLPSDAELIIVDDGSTDNSRQRIDEVVRNDARVQVIRNASPRGVSAALNAGLFLGTPPPFLAVAEHDDLVVRGRFELQIQALRANETLGAVSGSGRYLGPEGQVAGRAFPGPSSLDEFQQQRRRGLPFLLLHPCIMYRRDALVAIGGYDSDFDGAQDLELLSRMAYETNYGLLALPQDCVLYRVHPSATSFAGLARQREINRYVRYRSREQADGREWLSFPEWQLAQGSEKWQERRWARHDAGALRFRQAGLAWLMGKRWTAAGHLLAAIRQHPKWVYHKVKQQLKER